LRKEKLDFRCPRFDFEHNAGKTTGAFCVTVLRYRFAARRDMVRNPTQFVNESRLT